MTYCVWYELCRTMSYWCSICPFSCTLDELNNVTESKKCGYRWRWARFTFGPIFDLNEVLISAFLCPQKTTSKRSVATKCLRQCASAALSSNHWIAHWFVTDTIYSRGNTHRSLIDRASKVIFSAKLSLKNKMSLEHNTWSLYLKSHIYYFFPDRYGQSSSEPTSR